MDDLRDFATQGLKGLEPLSQTNYVEWRDVVDDYLDSQNWLKYSKDGLPTDANETLRSKSAKIAVVLKSAAGSQRTYLLGLRTPKDILSKLEEINGGSSRGTLASLQREFSTPDSRKKVDEVAALLSQLQAQIGGLSIEDKPTELSKKDILLRCYQEKYRTTVETLRIVATDYSFAQIVERLRQVEFEAKNIPIEAALQASDNTYKASGKKESRKCYYCGKIGHIKPDCKKKKSDEKKRNFKKNEPKPETASFAWKASGIISMGEKDWCIDSGASSHMTSDPSIFTEYESFFSKVGTAKSGISLKVIGRGKINCPINGQNTTFEGVLHVPELSSNLLSPGKLTSAGLSVNLGANEVIISRGRNVVAKGPRIGDTWILRGHNSPEQAFKANTLTQEEKILWHRRLGHPGPEKLSLISQAVTGMPRIKNDHILDCNTCNLTKSVRKQSREIPENLASKCLERVFIDTWGPYKHTSLGGKQYMLVIVDEFSRMSWVYFMKHKSDVLNILPVWKREVELESGKKLVKVRSDGAPELKRAISDLLVIHETTTANTPEQNAKVERMNRTNVTKARSMLAGPGLPKRLWAEAMSTACYLNNITPSVNRHKSPFELWTGNKPSVKHLKVYGCVAYVYVDKNKRDKLDLNAKKGVFIGYRRSTKQYRILNPRTGSIIESSHVVFREDQKEGSIVECTDTNLFDPTNNLPEQVFDQEEQERIISFQDLATDEVVVETRNEESDDSQEVPSEHMEPINSTDQNLRPHRKTKPPQRLIEELGREADERHRKEQAKIALSLQETSQKLTPSSFQKAIKNNKIGRAHV